jgi:hypothetical protein
MGRIRVRVVVCYLGEDDVIAEVRDLHELVIKYLVLASLTGDVVLLVLQALEHKAAA